MPEPFCGRWPRWDSFRAAARSGRSPCSAFSASVIGASLRGVMEALVALPLFDIGMNERMIFLDRVRDGGARRAGPGTAERGGWHPPSGVRGASRSRRSRRHLCSARSRSFRRWRCLPVTTGSASCCRSFPWRSAARSSSFSAAAGARAPAWAPPSSCSSRSAASRRSDVYPTYPSRAFYPPIRSFEAIPRDAPERMTAVGFTFIPNIAALYELEDVRGYEAMTFKPYFETLPALVRLPARLVQPRGRSHEPFLSFLNVRYVFAPPDDSSRRRAGRRFIRGDEGLLLENPAGPSAAFVPRLSSLRDRPRIGGRSPRTVRSFADRGVVGRLSGRDVRRRALRQRRGRTVRIASYAPQRMTLDSRGEEPALVATSMTAWPGWKLTVDGAKAPLALLQPRVSRFSCPFGPTHGGPPLPARRFRGRRLRERRRARALRGARPAAGQTPGREQP